MTRKPERGQALVEFALIIPIMLLLMLGLFDLGRIVFTRNGLNDGARQGAREASIDPRAAGYCARVDAAVRAAILGQDLSTYRVDYSTVSGAGVVTPAGTLCNNGTATGVALPLTAQPGDRVRVVLGANLSLATPLVSSVVGGGGFAVDTESTMNVTFAP